MAMPIKSTFINQSFDDDHESQYTPLIIIIHIHDIIATNAIDHTRRPRGRTVVAFARSQINIKSTRQWTRFSPGHNRHRRKAQILSATTLSALQESRAFVLVAILPKIGLLADLIQSRLAQFKFL